MGNRAKSQEHKKQILRQEIDGLKAYAVKIYLEEQHRSLPPGEKTNFTTENPSSDDDDDDNDEEDAQMSVDGDGDNDQWSSQSSNHILMWLCLIDPVSPDNDFSHWSPLLHPSTSLDNGFMVLSTKLTCIP